MHHSRLAVAVGLMAALAIPVRVDAAAAALSGSMASMMRQHEVALTYSYGFMETPADVQQHIESGHIVHVPGGADYALSNVSFPYAVAEVRLFIERLAAEYRAETGEQLVVTSLTRPSSLQPANAHDLSVHPAGMAVDLRIPARASARNWLQKRLLELEQTGVLDVTRERVPPHYHVAVYPVEYAAYAARVDSARAVALAIESDAVVATPSTTQPAVNAPAEDAQADAAVSNGKKGMPTEIPLLVGSMLASVGFVARRRRSRPLRVSAVRESH